VGKPSPLPTQGSAKVIYFLAASRAVAGYDFANKFNFFWPRVLTTLLMAPLTWRVWCNAVCDNNRQLKRVRKSSSCLFRALVAAPSCFASHVSGL